MLSYQSNLGALGIDPLTATGVSVAGASALFSMGTALFGGGKAAKEAEEQIRAEKLAQIRAQTMQKRALAQQQKAQRQEMLLGLSQQRRAEQTTLLLGVGVLALGVSGIFLYQAFKKKKRG